ncbi:glutamate carboxypeptidase [Kribbella sp. VKM Ac-2571]|uniref:M20/M25/M40 family metallo-hydrolase n=1 Tax=Kribbella sp. VKM Ac-2571 TaxID=2512222 RepID=UPI00105F4941|nr:M20/M25/M40 family metallo-hydrolase [Kribbella sp. VKM Ac-2571]TDO54007.1 glutamate carboxypeptidase [Kribbella sp. VKM Ac-2571]
MMIERLREYVGTETPTGDAAALNAFADRLGTRYAELGANVRRVPTPAGDHLVADFPGRGPRATEAPLLFLAHHDTVWPIGQLQGAMPWREQDGVIHGPGVFDMKGGLVVFETALEQIAGRDHRPLRIVVVADEEIGSPSARSLVTAEAKGVYAAFGFEPPHPNGDLKTSRWGSTRVRIEVTGREAHAALDPASGVSAIDELVDQLIAVRRIVADHDEVLCNVGTITGGGRTNVVPGSAAADIGFRFVDPATEESVLRAVGDLRPVREAQLAVRVLSNRPAWQPSAATEDLLAKVIAAGRSVGQEVGGAAATGAADTNLTGWLGIPTLDGLGPIGKGAHAVHEQVIAATLTERADLVAAIISSL